MKNIAWIIIHLTLGTLNLFGYLLTSYDTPAGMAHRSY